MTTYRIGLFILMGLGFIEIEAQPFWLRKFDYANLDNPIGIVKGDDDTFYVVHRYDEGNLSPVFGVISKMDVLGDTIWQLTFSNNNFYVFAGPTALLLNGDLLVAFFFDDPEKQEYRFFHISPGGTIKNIIIYPGVLNDGIDYAVQFYKVIPINKNEIRLFFRMNNYSPKDPPTAKNGYITLDSLGNELNRFIFNSFAEYHWPYNVISTLDNKLVRVYRPTLGALDLTLRYEFLDLNNVVQWDYEIGPESIGNGGPICTDSIGNIYFTWLQDTSEAGPPSYQFPSIISVDKNGDFRWMSHFGEFVGSNLFIDIFTTADGRVIACGQNGNSILSGGNIRTGWIVCVDSTGKKLWEHRYILEEARWAGNNFIQGFETDNGELVFTGILYNKQNGSDVYVIKLDSSGCFIEECDLYNRVSFTTNTSNIIAQNNVFSLNLNDGVLRISSVGLLIQNKLQYSLISSNGLLIGSGRIESENTEYNISGFPAGLYFVLIQNKNGEIIYKDKIVKSY